MKRLPLAIAAVLLAGAVVPSQAKKRSQSNCPDAMTADNFSAIRPGGTGLIPFPPRDQRNADTAAKWTCGHIVWQFADYRMGLYDATRQGSQDWIRFNPATGRIWTPAEQAEALMKIDKELLRPAQKNTDKALALGDEILAAAAAVANPPAKAEEAEAWTKKLGDLVSDKPAEPRSVLVQGPKVTAFDQAIRDTAVSMGIVLDVVKDPNHMGMPVYDWLGKYPINRGDLAPYKKIANKHGQPLAEEDMKIVAEKGDGANASLLTLIDWERRNALAEKYAEVHAKINGLIGTVAKQNNGTVSGFAKAATEGLKAHQTHQAQTGAADQLRAAMMGEGSDYQKLKAIFDKNSGNAEWLASEEGKGVAASMKAIEGTKFDGDGRVQYTSGGKIITDSNITVADVTGKDEQGRKSLGAQIAADIIAGNLGKAKYEALVAAITNPAPAAGHTNLIVSPQTPIQAGKTAAAADPCRGKDSAMDAVSKGAGCSVRNDFQAYSNAQIAAASKVSSESSAARLAKEKDVAAKDQATDLKLEKDIAAVRDQIDLSPAAQDKKISELKERAQVEKDQRAVTAYGELEKNKQHAGGEQAAVQNLLDCRHKNLQGAYGQKILKSAAELRSQYKTVGSVSSDWEGRRSVVATGRRARLEADSGFAGHNTSNIPKYVDEYFQANWTTGGANTDTNVGTCKAALGLSDKAAGSVDEANEKNDLYDATPSDLADRCGIHDALVAHVKSKIGGEEYKPADQMSEADRKALRDKAEAARAELKKHK